ncbi:unnamed protein product, partial [Ectocarpus fasciculatus]
QQQQQLGNRAFVSRTRREREETRHKYKDGRRGSGAVWATVAESSAAVWERKRAQRTDTHSGPRRGPCSRREVIGFCSLSAIQAGEVPERGGRGAPLPHARRHGSQSRSQRAPAGTCCIGAAVPKGHPTGVLSRREPAAVGTHERQARGRFLRTTPDLLLDRQGPRPLPRVLHRGGGQTGRKPAARVAVVLRGLREVGELSRGRRHRRRGDILAQDSRQPVRGPRRDGRRRRHPRAQRQGGGQLPPRRYGRRRPQEQEPQRQQQG